MRSLLRLFALSRSVRRLDQHGGASWITYLLLIAVVGGGYLLWAYAPVYLDNYAAGSRCEEVINATWRYQDEAKTGEAMRRKLAALAKDTVEENGELIKVPAIDPEESDLVVEIDNSVVPPVMSIDVYYTRTVVLPLLKKARNKSFHVHCEITLEEASWK